MKEIGVSCAAAGRGTALKAGMSVVPISTRGSLEFFIELNLAAGYCLEADSASNRNN